MSRLYRMTIAVCITDEARQDNIIDAICDEWGIDYSYYDEETMRFLAIKEGHLSSESEPEFVDRISQAIWKANGSYCKIDVCVTCLDDLPYEEHSRNIDDYNQFISKKETKCIITK
ncbi:hypothetical protein LCGC14_1397510 [marine sediment metagenome]|uniref:Uncharacterized protein n=1 Tax=marine sediment metagenome TaxID=412755 RepID=A0A0F9JYA1_9ZZZZ